MLKCQRNACVCALIVACKILSMSSWPLLINARIPNLGQFKVHIFTALFFRFMWCSVLPWLFFGLSISILFLSRTLNNRKFTPSEYDGTFDPAEPQADSLYAEISCTRCWALSPWSKTSKWMLLSHEVCVFISTMSSCFFTTSFWFN